MHFLYIIFTPNLGIGIAVSDREREQGHFRGNREGANKCTKRAWMNSEGA